jgi:hypothetical protein
VEELVAPLSGNYRIEIRAEFDWESIPSDMMIDLFTPTKDLPSAFRVPEGSLNDASVIEGVISVAAVCPFNGQIREYSSEGPTADGRLKPDITAFDGVSTFTYDPASTCNGGFLGTSASAPHIAGALALLIQRSGISPADGLGVLADLAVDGGVPGPDNRFGMGVLDLALPPEGVCRGLDATIVAEPGQLTIEGTAGPDVIVGNGLANMILAGGGADVVCGLGGPDLILGEAGKDWISGGPGADSVSGGDHRDRIRGEGGGDLLQGGAGGDKIRGGASQDDIRGEGGGDLLWGGVGNDQIRGGGSSDSLDGGDGSDLLDGGGSTDVCAAGEEHVSCESLL